YWCRPPQEQIDWFVRNVPRDPDALPPVLDVELTPTSRTCRRILDRAEVLAEMRELLIGLERHYGKRPVIYTTVDFYEGILHPHEFTDYPMWVRSTKYPPQVKYPGRKWVFWQYQSDAIVPGIVGKTDRNVFHGNARQWKAFLDGPK
ncbi:MAG: glycoside hydrolase family 25, partial [Methylobacteriaceae bacterium]|nr:glycoside hydrolase family 25 [Methylobacteriaceae bacterium]